MERKPPIRREIKPVKPVSQSSLPKTPSIKNIALNQSLTQPNTRSQVPLIPVKLPFKYPDYSLSQITTELSHRQRKFAKKRFKKGKQVPHGMYLQYSIYTSINVRNLILPPSVIRQQELIKSVAQHLFNKNYDKLTSSQQTKVFDYLNDSETKTEWLSAKGQKVKREETTSKNEFIH